MATLEGHALFVVESLSLAIEALGRQIRSMSTRGAARFIADRAGGQEGVLRRLLRETGARVIRATSEYSLRGDVQIKVRFPDGVIGIFNPGGPSHMITYQWFEGHRPGDELIEGTRFDTLDPEASERWSQRRSRPEREERPRRFGT